MKKPNRYRFEYGLLAVTFLLSFTGFWNIYFGDGASATPYHHLHVVTTIVWLSLLLWQLRLIDRNDFRRHRKAGLSVMIVAPLLIASTALLSVHSAHKGLVSGRGDFLIVQNVGVTVELAMLVLLGFILRKRRKLHASLLMSTTILFMGIALFFTLLSFVPMFKIAGPETFYRFGTAAATGQGVCLIVGLLFFFRDWRNGWPLLMAGGFFVLNEWIRSSLTERNLMGPLTKVVGSMNQTLTFVGTFGIVLALLAATGIRGVRPSGKEQGSAMSPETV